MKVRINFWAIVFFAGSILVQILAFGKVYRDNKRLSDNFAAIAKSTEYFRINDSISAARSERLLLDNAEIKAYFPEIRRTIGQMDVKMRQLERYSAIGSTANYQINSKIQKFNDSTIQQFQNSIIPEFQNVIFESLNRNRNNESLNLQTVEFKDRWIDFKQYIIADSAYTDIQTRDSIAIVQSWTRPYRFLFVNWGRKKHVQTVVNFNPYSKLTYSIYVEKK